MVLSVLSHSDLITGDFLRQEGRVGLTENFIIVPLLEFEVLSEITRCQNETFRY